MKSKEKYPIEKISFEWVEKATDVKEVKKAYEAIKEEGGYYDLEQALKNKFAELDPSFKRRIEEKPLSKQEKEVIDNDIQKFIDAANEDDESLQGKNAQNIFSNPKEEAAARIGKRKQAENERMKGNDFMKAKDYDKAIESYDKAISLDPTEAYTYSNRSMAYLKKKQYSRSIEDANKAIELDSDCIKAYYRRGKANEGLCNYEASIKDYEYIQEKEPSNKRIKKELLSLRAAYKDYADRNKEKKFTKMNIVEEGSSKVEEIVETKPVPGDHKDKSEDPVIAEEGESNENINTENIKQENGKTTKAEVHEVPKANPKNSEFVKLDINEEDSSSEDEDDKREVPEKIETKEAPIKTKEEEIPPKKSEKSEEKLTDFDKDFLKNEKLSDNFINSFDEEIEADGKVHRKEKEAHKKQEEENHMKVEEMEVPEPTPEELKELELLEKIDEELKDYKERAKAEHKKGMFDLAINIYEDALLCIDQQEKFIKHKFNLLVSKK